MNYATVLKSSLIPEKEESKATKAEDSKATRADQKSKATKVLELLQNGSSMTQRDIAKFVDCHETYVAQVKKAKTMAEQQPWYERHVSEAGEFDPSDQPITYTSNLFSRRNASQGDLRDITAEERAEHILNIQAELEEAKSTKQLLRRALFQGARKETFHGFVLAELEQIMSKEDCKAFGDILHKKLPALLANKKSGAADQYGACFSPIFEYVQLAPLGPGEERGNAEKEEERRMGDMKRSQAKLSALLETASIRVKSAQDDVDKCVSIRGKKRRSVESVLAHIKKEEALLLDLLRFMRKHHDCIREVRKSSSMLKDEILEHSRGTGVAGAVFEGRVRPGPFRHHSLRG